MGLLFAHRTMCCVLRLRGHSLGGGKLRASKLRDHRAKTATDMDALNAVSSLERAIAAQDIPLLQRSTRDGAFLMETPGGSFGRCLGESKARSLYIFAGRNRQKLREALSLLRRLEAQVQRESGGQQGPTDTEATSTSAAERSPHAKEARAARLCSRPEKRVGNRAFSLGAVL